MSKSQGSDLAALASAAVSTLPENNPPPSPLVPVPVYPNGALPGHDCHYPEKCDATYVKYNRMATNMGWPQFPSSCCPAQMISWATKVAAIGSRNVISLAASRERWPVLTNVTGRRINAPVVHFFAKSVGYHVTGYIPTVFDPIHQTVINVMTLRYTDPISQADLSLDKMLKLGVVLNACAAEDLHSSLSQSYKRKVFRRCDVDCGTILRKLLKNVESFRADEFSPLYIELVSLFSSIQKSTVVGDTISFTCYNGRRRSHLMMYLYVWYATKRFSGCIGCGKINESYPTIEKDFPDFALQLRKISYRISTSLAAESVRMIDTCVRLERRVCPVCKFYFVDKTF